MTLWVTLHRRRFVAGFVCGGMLAATVCWAISWSHRRSVAIVPNVASRLLPNGSQIVTAPPDAYGIPPGYQFNPLPFDAFDADGGVPIIPNASPPSLPDGWQRKEFNGSEYYVAPLAMRE